MYYAEINAENICIAILETSREICAATMIQIASYDVSLLGKKRVGDEWEDVEQLPAGRIRTDAFKDRFRLLTEQKKMMASDDPLIKAIIENIKERPYINVELGLTILAVECLRDMQDPNTGEYYLDGATETERQARYDAILAYGTPEEAA